MTVSSNDSSKTVKLEVSQVSTIHASEGSLKIASLCIVVKDTEATELLQLNPQAVPKMVIVDVVPLKDDATKVEVFFRNLNEEEFVEETRRYLMPSNSLGYIFDGFFQVEAEDIDEEDDEYDDDYEEDEEDEEEEDKSSFPAESQKALEQLMEANREALESPGEKSALLNSIFQAVQAQFSTENLVSDDTNLYSVVISLAEAHLGQFLCLSTNAPAFALTSEAGFDALSSRGEPNSWEDFLAILEFPHPDSPEYFDSTARLIQSTTGSFPLNIKIEDFNQLRAGLMDKIISLSNGRSDSLIKSFGYINPMNKAFSNRNKDIKPTHVDSVQFATSDAIDKIYNLTSPASIDGLIGAPPITTNSLEEIKTLDNLLESSGLNETFSDILAEEYEKQPLVLSANPTIEEMRSYYSAPVTRSSFPASMQDLAEKIQMPLFFAHNWTAGNVSIQETLTNVGEIKVSKIFAIAVRYARLKEIVEHLEEKFVPAVLLLRALNFSNEVSTWAYLGSVKIMSKEPAKISRRDFFSEIMLPGLHSEENSDSSPEQVLSAPTPVILHKVAHLILNEEWDKDLLVSKAKTDVLNGFLDELYNISDGVLDLEVEAKSNKPCPVMQALYSFLTQEVDATEIVLELGQLIITLGELSALKNTDFTQDSEAWTSYIENYYSKLFKR